MLDRLKMITELQNSKEYLFHNFYEEIEFAHTLWSKISHDPTCAVSIHSIKQPLLVPYWQGLLGQVITLEEQKQPYTVIAVDGSQIYYDKHQGPPCFLINIGFIQLWYGFAGKGIDYGTQPFLSVKFNEENDFASPDFINMQRELYEFEYALSLMNQTQLTMPNAPLFCLFDGSLIFFHLDTQNPDLKDGFLKKYCDVLEQCFLKNMMIGAYMSLPRTKELVNICKIYAQKDPDCHHQNFQALHRLTDVDIANFYLKPGQRSIVFKSKAPISYLYPVHLQPHFCYLHVGFEVVRLEFPSWIAASDEKVNQLCSVAFDQSNKGHGYPVCLFEAHEQAVIKAADRDFFYQMIAQLSKKESKEYLISQKSMRKQQPIV